MTKPFRFIPARAGIGCFALAASMACAVHPRSCGDRLLSERKRFMNIGSSPLVRGSGPKPDTQHHERRFIPARAGIGTTKRGLMHSAAVHPRSCGDRKAAGVTTPP